MKTYRIFMGLVGAFISNQSLAGTTSFGLGVTITDQLKIYFPIKNEQFLFEPSLTYINNKNETDDVFFFNSKEESLRLGIGFFKNDIVLKNIDIYYGARIGYIKSEYDISTVTKTNGYFLAPTIGATYYFNTKFSIGIDVSINYENTEGDVTSNISTIDHISSTATYTSSEVIIKYYF